MIRVRGDIWRVYDHSPHIVVIPVCGYVKRDGTLSATKKMWPLAYEALRRFPEQAKTIGDLMNQYGATILLWIDGQRLLSFPITQKEETCTLDNIRFGKYKSGAKVPGYHLKANELLVKRNLEVSRWKRQRCPKPWPDVYFPRLDVYGLPWPKLEPIVTPFDDWLKVVNHVHAHS